MSTTTSIKRIALVAVAALGFGMLSVVPSNAAVVANTLTIDSATDSITLGETATAVLTHSFVTTSAQDSVTITAIKTSANSATAGTIQFRPTDSSTSAGITDRPEYSYVKGSTYAGDNVSAAALWVASPGSQGFPDSLTVSNNNANLSVNSTFGVNLVNPTAAGTYVVTFYMTVSNSGAAGTVSTTSVTWTVTVAAADNTAVGSSTSVLRAGNGGSTWGDGTSATTDSAVAVARSSTRTTPDGIIKITQKNAAGTTLTGLTNTVSGESMTVTVTGGTAFVTTGTTATRPTSGTVATLANGAGGAQNYVYIWSNGVAGTATITTTTYSGLLIGTETVTFTGPVTGLAVTKSYNTMTAYGSIVRSGGRTSGNLVEITAKDSGARPIDGLTLTCVSSDASVITGCTVTAAADGTGEYYLAFTSASNSTSGQKATVTVRVVDPAVTTSVAYLTTTVDLTLGSTISTETIAFDKDVYAPGEGMVITRSAKDSSGNPVYDGAASVALTANKVLGGSALASCTYYAGTCSTSTMYAGAVLVKYNTYAPAAPGAFTVSGLGGLLGGVLLSATATVSDDAATAAATAATDAAAEAVDAANAATDAANAAAEAADAATAAAQDAADAVAALSASVSEMVNALKKQITSLTNLVIKIQKKVKA
jgi:trimeric autotransporter adhesin